MSWTLDNSKYLICEIEKSKFEMSKVYSIRLKKGIRKFEFVGKTQYLCSITVHLLFGSTFSLDANLLVNYAAFRKL